jgi:hypothetical protein
MSTDTIVVTIKAKTIGCYGTDAQGQPWYSWRGPAQTCAICGKEINHGWARGKWSQETHYCGEHVETVYER